MSFIEDRKKLLEYITDNEIFDADREGELEDFFEFIDRLEEKAVSETQYYSLIADAYMKVGHISKAKDAFKKNYNSKNKKDIKKLMNFESVSVKPIIRPTKRAVKLPHFKYVENKMLKNKFIISKDCPCSICKRNDIALYVGMAYISDSREISFMNQEEKFCVCCLSDGTAAKELELKFNSPMLEDCVNIEIKKREELLYRTPECSDDFDFNEYIWPDCCGDFCCYIGINNTYEDTYYFRCNHCGKEITWIRET